MRAREVDYARTGQDVDVNLQAIGLVKLQQEYEDLGSPLSARAEKQDTDVRECEGLKGKEGQDELGGV
jgi:hypothetical protein